MYSRDERVWVWGRGGRGMFKLLRMPITGDSIQVAGTKGRRQVVCYVDLGPLK